MGLGFFLDLEVDSTVWMIPSHVGLHVFGLSQDAGSHPLAVSPSGVWLKRKGGAWVQDGVLLCQLNERRNLQEHPVENSIYNPPVWLLLM